VRVFIDGYYLKNDITHTDEERSTIIDWLSAFDFRKKQSNIFEKRADCTGQWLLKSQVFKNWLTWNSETLWWSGIRKRHSPIHSVFDFTDCRTAGGGGGGGKTTIFSR
jgi:hypothetical protein